MSKGNNEVHIMAGSKGGCGKSVSASLLFQYLESIGQSPIGFDADPANQTFAGYQGLNIHTVDAMDGDDINKGKFDSMVEQIIATEEPVVVDNGASNYIAFMSYIKSSSILELLVGLKKEVFIHSVVAAGQSLNDTLQDLNSILEAFSGIEGVKVVIWENEFEGPVVVNDKTLDEMKFVKSHKSSIMGIVTIGKMDEHTFGRDFSNMLTKKQTFRGMIDLKETPIITKHRLEKLKGELFANIGMVLNSDVSAKK